MAYSLKRWILTNIYLGNQQKERRLELLNQGWKKEIITNLKQ